MSLEERMADLTAALLENTSVQRQLLSAAGAEVTESTETATGASNAPRERGKPSPGKAKRTKAEIDEDNAADAADAAAKSGGVTFDVLKAGLAGWLGEFAKAEDKTNPEGIHPEVTARRTALKKTLVKLTGNEEASLGLLADDAEKITKLNDWLENTAKPVEKGFGVGRLAADPAPAAASKADDDLDI